MVGYLLTPKTLTASFSLSLIWANVIDPKKSIARAFHSGLVTPLLVNRIAFADSFFADRNSSILADVTRVTWFGMRSARASEMALAVRGPW